MFALVRFEPKVILTQESQEILKFLNYEQRMYLSEQESSFETLTQEIVVATYLTWELAVKPLSRYEGEAIKNTITGEYFGVEVLEKC